MSLVEKQIVGRKIDKSMLLSPKTPMRANIREFMSNCAQRYALEEPIIDIACGHRNNYPEIVEIVSDMDSKEPTYPTYIAFDYVNSFHQEIEQGLGPDLLADAHSISLRNGVVGTVVCTEVLEHVKDDVKVVSEMSRILKAGGRLILTVPGKDVPIHERFPYYKDYRRHSPDGLFRLLDMHGFTDIELSEQQLEGRQINIFVICKKISI